jgi:hypothetical protein
MSRRTQTATTRLEKRIRDQMFTLRERISSGDNSRLCVWILPGQLAASQRPLRDDPCFPHKDPLPLSARSKVQDWVKHMKQEVGIRSVICLLTARQLKKYYISGGLELHSEGLLGYYTSQELEVSPIETPDFQRPSSEIMDRALVAFQTLPKPILLHCSAAIDRTTPVAAFIASKCDTNEISPELREPLDASPRASGKRPVK